MIEKEKLMHVIDLAMKLEWEHSKEDVEQFAKTLESLNEEELKDIAALMLIGQNERHYKKDENDYYEGFEEYFHDARERFCYNGKYAFICCLIANTSLVKNLEDGYRNLHSKMFDRKVLSKMSLYEKIELVINTSLRCRIIALEHGRFETEPEDRVKLKKVLDAMSEEDIAEITSLSVRGGRSYFEKAMLFRSKAEMCSYLVANTDKLVLYIPEGCIIRDIEWPRCHELIREYEARREELNEKLLYEE